MLNRVGLIMRGLAAVLLVLVSARVAAAEEKRLPVPAVSIRAGELIRDDMITERAFAPNLLGVAMFIEGRQVLVGRMARRALLPGQPIPTNSVEDPWTVARGAMVKVVVEDRGLSIVTYGSATNGWRVQFTTATNRVFSCSMLWPGKREATCPS